MCDYCGCRSKAPLTELGADHDQLTTLAGALRAALDTGDTSGAAELADRLAAGLADHGGREEAGLFAELAAADEATYLDRFLGDHRRFDTVLAPGAARDWAAVRAVLDELAAHIRDEESDMFPFAWQVLDDAAWDRVDAVHATARAAAGGAEAAREAPHRHHHA